ncbi:MAG: glycosyltransferase family 4 protein [Haliea sp.]|uniref:glycosyltransferase family 4 protein n=1 Tax=Haliea sp. TaxID=1932666 RepID=UPI0032EBE7E0
MRIVHVCNTDGALSVFRGPLIKALSKAGHEVYTISARSDYFDELRKLGAHPIELPMDRHGVGLFSNLKLFIGLYKCVKGLAPDIVHNFTHKPAIFGTLAAKLAGVKTIVITVTGLGTVFVNDGAKNKFVRAILLLHYAVVTRLAITTFFQNPDDQRLFESAGVTPPNKSVLTNGSGIDLTETILPTGACLERAREELSAELGTPLEDKRIVIFPARGVKEKGFFEYYQAAKRIHQRYPSSYVFLHVGLIDSSLSNSISGRDLGVHALDCGVTYLGFRRDIMNIVAASDIVCLPSYREGTPRSLIEALALGKVIVTTDAPGCRETVIPGENGYWCSPRDVSGLVDALLRVDDTMIDRSKTISRTLCEKKYDVDHLIELTEKAYFGADRHSEEQ